MGPADDMTQPDYSVIPNLSDSYGPQVEGFLAGKDNKCYVVLSPDTRFIYRTRISAILGWVIQHASHVAVVEGSYVQRWNYIVLQGLSEQEAYTIAAAKALRIRRRIQRVVNDNSWMERVRIVDYQSEIDSESFVQLRSEIVRFYVRNQEFQASVHSEVRDFLSRRPATGAVQGSQSLQLLANYILEEIAFFCYMHTIGYRIEVYPGVELGVMREIVLGGFADFPVDLSDRTQLSIRVQRN